MKHDPELIRHILDHVARSEGGVKAAEIPASGGHAAANVSRHIALLIEHELLEGTTHFVHGLTAKGHALQRALHDKDVREKIRHTAEHLGEDVTLEIILNIAKTFLIGL